MPSAIVRIVAVIVLLAGVVALGSSHVRVLSDPQDLRAFYCAGATVLAHHDPYLAEPLRSCELRAARLEGLALFPHLALPAPLPAYAFVPFALLSIAPFDGASSLFAIVTLVSIAATFLIVRRLVRTPIVAIAASLMLSEGLVALLAGQIVPIVVLALCASAFEIRRKRFALASAYAAVAGIEPHLALPAWLCLTIVLPKTRAPLAICAVSLAAIAIVVVGLPINIEYFRYVLPAHALSELAATGQYSLSTLAYTLGAGAALSVALGNLSYAATCVLGIVVARKLATIYDAPELLVLIPPAFAVFGGPFVHYSQMAIAIVALIVLADHIPTQRTPFVVALVALAVPWPELTLDPPLAMDVAIVAVVVVLTRFAGRFSRGGIGATVLCGIALGALERYAQAHPGSPFVDPTRAMARVDGASQLAEATWTVLVSAIEHQGTTAYLIARAPAWAALAVMIATACIAAFGTRNRASLENAS